MSKQSATIDKNPSHYPLIQKPVKAQGEHMVPKSIEVEGKTTKEAIAIALKKLRVTKDQVEIKILSEEQQGLFGMNGGKLAKIKVTLKKSSHKRHSP